MRIRDGKLIYHLVPLDSLASIMEHGLMSRDSLAFNHIDYLDTANQEILNKRERLGLSQYIPFHFHIHTAYDTAVKNTNSDTTFVYICLHRDFARNNHFLVLPNHPVSNEQPELFEYDAGIEAIDWETMELTKSEAEEKGVDSRYHQQVRMAECLSPVTIQADSFQQIAVPNEETKDYVISLLFDYNIRKSLYINIQPWFV